MPIVLPIELLIVLPIELPIVLPIALHCLLPVALPHGIVPAIPSGAAVLFRVGLPCYAEWNCRTAELHEVCRAAWTDQACPEPSWVHQEY